MQDNTIQLAVIDMAGTTVADDGLVAQRVRGGRHRRGRARDGARARHGAGSTSRHHGPVEDHRVPRAVRTEELAQQANAAFEQAYERAHRRRQRRTDRRCRTGDHATARSGCPGGADDRLQRDDAGEAAGRARLAVAGRPRARTGRRRARAAQPRPDPDRADAPGDRRRAQRRLPRRHQQRHRKRAARRRGDRRRHAHRRPQRRAAACGGRHPCRRTRCPISPT